MISLISILQRLVANLDAPSLGGIAVLALLIVSGVGGRLMALVEERTNGSR